MKEVFKEFNNCLCTCDSCGHEEMIDDTSYTRINNELRGMGWTITKMKNKFVDFCSEDCLKNYKRKLLDKENREDGFTL